MSEQVMPKFDFGQVSFSSQEELDGALKQDVRSPKFFRPGRYSVVIEGTEYKGAAKDPNWGKLVVTHKGTGDLRINNLILLPLSDVKYKTASGKGEMLPFHNFKVFCTAIGIKEEELTLEALPQTLKTYFADPSVLHGLNVTIEVGYQNAHVGYVKVDGGAEFNIIDRNGNAMTDASGKELRFANRDAAEAHCKANNIRFDAFTDVLTYDAPATPNDLSALTSTDW